MSSALDCQLCFAVLLVLRYNRIALELPGFGLFCRCTYASQGSSVERSQRYPSMCCVTHLTELWNVLITFVTNGLSRHNSSHLCSLRI